MEKEKSLLEKVLYYFEHKEEIDKIVEEERKKDPNKSLIERAAYYFLYEKENDEEHRRRK